MPSLLFLLLSASFMLSITSAVLTQPAILPELSPSSPLPIPPTQDPFYTAPIGFESTKPGTILRIRQAPGNLTSIISNSSAAYNIVYRTSDTRYRASWAVTTLFIPKSANVSVSRNSNGTSDASSLLSYQIPYNTANVDASPSYGIYNLYAAVGGGITTDIAAALGRGWYVNVPDFEGPLASFAAGVQAGHATLDSVRAALSAGLGMTPKQTNYAMWGYSGGSIASEFAAELQVQYAPELNFSGAALGGLVPNLTALIGVTRQYPQAWEFLSSRLKDEGLQNRTGFLAAENMTVTQSWAAFASQVIYGYFVNGEADIQDPIMQNVFDSNVYMGYHGVPQMPLFVYKAVADKFSPVGDTDVLIQRYCGIGANILYQRNTVGGHIAEITNGDGRALEWLVSVFDGTQKQKYEAEGCVIQDVTVNITDAADF